MNNNTQSHAMDALLIERLVLSTTAHMSQPKPTERYLERARTAARCAAELRKLDAAVHVAGFQALSLPDYLSSVAQHAQVRLSNVMTPGAKGTSPASVWISLAKSVGMAAERIRLHLRLWVAENLTVHQAVQVLERTGHNGGFRHSNPLGGMSESQVSAQLDVIEATYTPEARTQLEACLAELEPAF